jgi:hypothetical protein
MTCHVCAKPNCVDDCTNFPPPALKIGSAEHKLQELLKIADEMAKGYFVMNGDRDHICAFCDGGTSYKQFDIDIIHTKECPTLKLEQFKASLS